MKNRFKVIVSLLLVTIMLCLNITIPVHANSSCNDHKWVSYETGRGYRDMPGTSYHIVDVYYRRYCTLCNLNDLAPKVSYGEGHSLSRNDSHMAGNKHFLSEYCTRCDYTNTQTISCSGNPCLIPW